MPQSNRELITFLWCAGMIFLKILALHLYLNVEEFAEVNWFYDTGGHRGPLFIFWLMTTCFFVKEPSWHFQNLITWQWRCSELLILRTVCHICPSLSALIVAGHPDGEGRKLLISLEEGEKIDTVQLYCLCWACHSGDIRKYCYICSKTFTIIDTALVRQRKLLWPSRHK